MSSKNNATQPSTKLSAQQLKMQQILLCLSAAHPDAVIELNFSNPRELLIATILSAQCTDVRVNQVTKELFVKFKTAEDYLSRPLAELEEIIHPTGFFRNKAKNIRGAMERLILLHSGEVPRTMAELTALPGVGRKTANVVLGNAFNLPGLPVDTHVTRLSQRLGLTTSSDAVKIEEQLTKLIPEAEWCRFSHQLIFHGRRICKARKPLCELCNMQTLCPEFSRLEKTSQNRSNNQKAKKSSKTENAPRKNQKSK